MPRAAADACHAFFFMEMNTRLQVEHPVTEMITGLDLVEWQLRVAAGEPLPRSQEQLAIARPCDRGAHLRRGCRPADLLRPPARSSTWRRRSPRRNVRLDAGVAQGDAITPHYDPMIAKLIAWDVDRDAARARACVRRWRRRASSAWSTTSPFWRAWSMRRRSPDALLDTDLIERDAAYPGPARAQPPARESWLLAALAQLEREAGRMRARARAGPPGASATAGAPTGALRSRGPVAALARPRAPKCCRGAPPGRKLLATPRPARGG